MSSQQIQQKPVTVSIPDPKTGSHSDVPLEQVHEWVEVADNFWSKPTVLKVGPPGGRRRKLKRTEANQLRNRLIEATADTGGPGPPARGRD